MANTNGEQLPYDQTTTQAWLDEVNSWPWIQLGPKKWKKAGLCPRCKHEMYVPLYPVPVIITDAVAEADRFIVPAEVYGECNCGHSHPNQPENETGCGPAGFFPTPTSPEDTSPFTASEVG